MKNFKKLLLVAVAALSFAACGDDDDKKKDTTPKVNVSTFKGTFTVSWGNFSMDNNDVQTSCDDATKLCQIKLNSVTFSDKMPMQMDLVIDSVSFSANNGDTTLVGANLTPSAVMNGQTMNAGFPISAINGKISNGKLTLSLDGTYTQMSMNMTLGYEGTRK